VKEPSASWDKSVSIPTNWLRWLCIYLHRALVRREKRFS
jgi:hypothetical protein